MYCLKGDARDVLIVIHPLPLLLQCIRGKYFRYH